MPVESEERNLPTPSLGGGGGGGSSLPLQNRVTRSPGGPVRTAGPRGLFSDAMRGIGPPPPRPSPAPMQGNQFPSPPPTTGGGHGHTGTAGLISPPQTGMPESTVGMSPPSVSPPSSAASAFLPPNYQAQLGGAGFFSGPGSAPGGGLDPNDWLKQLFGGLSR